MKIALHLLAVGAVLGLGVLTFANFGRWQLAAVGSGSGATLYVDNAITGTLDGAGNCLDTYDPATRACGSGTARAYGKIQAAADAVNPGDQVEIRGGRYVEGVLLRRSGTANAWIEFEPYNDESVVVQPGVVLAGWQPSTAGANIWEINLTQAYADKILLNQEALYVNVIELNGDAFSNVASLADLVNPISFPWGSRTINTAQYNLSFFDPATTKLYVRPVNPGSWNPSNLFVIEGSKRIDFSANYLSVKGLTVEYGFEGFRAENNTHDIKVIDNTVRHVSGNGIFQYKTSSNLLLDGNDVSLVGQDIHWVPAIGGGLAYALGQSHAFYLGGSDDVIRNNHLYQCKGQCFHPWTSATAPTRMEIYNNVVENGTAISGVGHEIYDNVFLGSDVGFALSETAGVKIHNNFFEAAIPFVAGSYGPGPGLEFKNNIVHATNVGESYCGHVGDLDLTQATFANNYYADCQTFSLGTVPAGTWKTLRGATNFTDYLTLLRAKSAMFEQGSLAGSVIWDSKYRFPAASQPYAQGIGPHAPKPKSTDIPPPLQCVENWSCTAYSACSSTTPGVTGTQTRTCTDAKACGTTANRPGLSRSCRPGETLPNEEPTPTPTPSPQTSLGAVFAPLVDKFALGQTGAHVAELQQMLWQLGLYNGSITGHYGPLTQAAVAAFQTKYGIGVTPETRGLAGPATRAKLNELLAGKPILDPASASSAANAALIAQLRQQLLSLLLQLKSLLEQGQ